ncbi:MAG: hypothetical protein ACYC2R_00895 [Burkholderiales bacterium]
MTRDIKTILLLGRRDHAEAMRVAAGLTIFGHRVRLVFMNTPVADTPENAEQFELLDLADIFPETTVAEEALPWLDASALAAAMLEADCVMSF